MKQEKINFIKLLGNIAGDQILLEQCHLIEEGNCPFCAEAGPFEFKNEASKKEFENSGMCQKCQDSFFANPDTEENNHGDDKSLS